NQDAKDDDGDDSEWQRNHDWSDDTAEAASQPSGALGIQANEPTIDIGSSPGRCIGNQIDSALDEAKVSDTGDDAPGDAQRTHLCHDDFRVDLLSVEQWLLLCFATSDNRQAYYAEEDGFCAPARLYGSSYCLGACDFNVTTHPSS